MGWDADALKDGQYLDPSKDAEVLAVFAEAARDVQKLAGHVDGYLFNGGLDLSGARRWLEEAIGQPAEGIFSPEEVQGFASKARWRNPQRVDTKHLSDYWAARKFLETCARCGLGIWME